MQLMFKDKPLTYTDEDTGELFFLDAMANSLPFLIRGRKNLDRQDLIDWVRYRAIPIDRHNAKTLLNTLEIPQHPPELAGFYAKGLSLIDCYWIKPDGSSETWSDVDLVRNRFSESIGLIAFTGMSPGPTIQGKMLTPELTAQGAYRKSWVREKDGIYLYKGNFKGNESEAEYITSVLLDILGYDHVNYGLTTYQGHVASKCKLMRTEEKSIVHAAEVADWLGSQGKNIHNYCLSNYREDYLKMVLVDGIVYNTDRHQLNWGFYMDNNTAQLTGLHPLYDHNNAFDFDGKDKPSLIYDGKTLIEAATHAYKQLGKPAEVDRLETQLHSRKLKNLFKTTFGGLRQWEGTVKNIKDIKGTGIQVNIGFSWD